MQVGSGGSGVDPRRHYEEEEEWWLWESKGDV